MTKLFAALVTAGFLALVAFEVHHDLILREPWPGYALIANSVVFAHAPLWLAGAVSVWIPRSWGWVGVLAGCFASVVHGVGVLAGGAQVGVVFLVAAPVLLILSALARPRRDAAPERDEALERGPVVAARGPR